MFAISATSAQSSSTFANMKDDIKEVIDKYGSTNSYWRYSLVVYGSTINTVVTFNSSFSSDTQLKQAVSSATTPSGLPDLDAALIGAESLLLSQGT